MSTASTRFALGADAAPPEPVLESQVLDMGLPADPPAELVEALVALLGAAQAGQLVAVSIFAVHRGGFVESLVSGRPAERMARHAAT